MVISGVGLGLRHSLCEPLLALPAAAAGAPEWLELHPENYVDRGADLTAKLRACHERWPIATHGLSLSLAGLDPPDRALLAELKAFLRATGAAWHSEHISIGSVGGTHVHELLPPPMNERTVRRVAARIRQLRDALDLPIAVENVCHYAVAPGSDLDEGTFVAAVAEEADCLVLLDVTNAFVNAVNHGHDPRTVISRIPAARIAAIHVAGHCEHDGVLLDSHAEPVAPEVKQLLAWTLGRVGRVPLLLERDDCLPPLGELLAEMAELQSLWLQAPAVRSAA